MVPERTRISDNVARVPGGVDLLEPKSTRERYILVTAIVVATKQGVWNNCVVER